MALNIFQLILYLAVLLALVTLARNLFRFFGDIGLPPTLTSSISCITLIYLSALLPGILGVLSANNSYILFIVLTICILAWIRVKTDIHENLPKVQIAQDSQIKLTPANWCSIGLGVILATPLLLYLRGLATAFVSPNPILGWDVISYHLPGIIEFYQAGSLWSMAGPYQSYSFGYELLGNYFSQNFHASWGLLLAHILSIWIVINAMTVISKTISSSSQSNQFNWLPLSILAIGIWTTLSINSIGMVGKNDIFMGAVVFSALAFLMLLGAQQKESSFRANLIILFIGTFLGLSVGAKLSAIPYLLYFWIATGWVLFSQKRKAKDALSFASLALLVAFLIGGFWICRNLVLIGKLSPVLDSGWQSSIIANVLNVDMYKAFFHSPAVLIASIAWVPASIIALMLFMQGSRSTSWWLMTSFHLVACLVFITTPFSYQNGGIELRLGMPFLLAAAIIYSALIQLVIQFLFSSKISKLLGYLFVLALMLSIPFYWGLKKQNALLGYESAFNCPDEQKCPKTNIYTWVHDLNEPKRIYSAGLRPYGLYGERWENILFYDLDSSTLLSEVGGKKRIAAILSQFEPELILISFAPNSNNPSGVRLKVVNWMQSRPDLFSEVYSDEIVNGFKVNPGAKEILLREFPEAYVLKMGG